MNIRIGVTTFVDIINGREFVAISYAYIHSIIATGAVPVPIPVWIEQEAIEKYLNEIDGIILSGGSDVSPIYYGEEPNKKLGGIGTRRDECELYIIKRSMEKKIPILGICRGCQIINIALGGTLYQDIETQNGNVIGHCPSNTSRDELYHSIYVEENSILYQMINKRKIFVNSFHHQSIKDLGSHLIITAKATDGIIECVEYVGDSFVMGIQCHPEDLTQKYHEFASIFKYFAKECEKHKLQNNAYGSTQE
jgi:putative glutamine amidotransferase